MCEAKFENPNQQPSVRRHMEAPQFAAPHNHQMRRAKAESENYMGFWWTSCLTVLGTAIIVAWIPNLLSPDPPKGNIDGFVVPSLKKVSDTFRLHLLSEEEKGAAFAVFKNGEVVVDLWGGYADIEAWQPWKKSTVANIFSLYSLAVSLSIGLLHERGLIDYERTVASYWPEFGRYNKERITVRNLLSEQSGLLRLNRTISLLNVSNEGFLREELANQKTSPPGYLHHDSDQALLELYADQLVRRVDPTHRSLKQFVEQEFTNKYGLDFYVGLPLTEQHRAARVRGHGFSVVFEVIFAPIELISTLLYYMKATTFTEINSIRRLNDPEVRLSSVGSISGFASARSLAQLYHNAVLADASCLSDSTWSHMLRQLPVQQHSNLNLASKLGLASDWTLTAAGQIRKSPNGSKIVGFSGFGGQYAYVDKDNNISVAYLTNYNSIYRSELDPRFRSLLRALYDSI